MIQPVDLRISKPHPCVHVTPRRLNSRRLNLLGNTPILYQDAVWDKSKAMRYSCMVSNGLSYPIWPSSVPQYDRFQNSHAFSG